MNIINKLFVYTCIQTWDDVLNDTEQYSQLKGFSPVCMRMCSCRFPF